MEVFENNQTRVLNEMKDGGLELAMTGDERPSIKNIAGVVVICHHN